MTLGLPVLKRARAWVLALRSPCATAALAAAVALSAVDDGSQAPLAADGERRPPRAATAAQGARLDEITVTLPGNVPLVMVRIPAGTFTMGSPDSEPGRTSNEGPQHQVTISNDIYLGKYEVTQAQWRAVMGTARPEGCDDYGVGDSYPAYCVSWVDVCGDGAARGEADGFLRRVNDHLVGSGQHSGGDLRLPSEAEWEYAARAGTTARFSFGEADECGDICGACAAYEQHMWWCGNAYYTTATHGARPVGQKLANPWGLYDIHGNVWELVADVYAPYDVEPQTDPVGSTSGWPHVARGGAWGVWAKSCRTARRGSFLPPNPRYRYYALGLRLARSQ